MQQEILPESPSLQSFSLTRLMTVDQVDWEGVAKYLVKSGKFTPPAARREIVKLLDPYGALLEISWFQHRKPSQELHSVISALCQVHSIDGIILKKEQKIGLFGITCFRYSETLNMAPSSGCVDRPLGDEMLIPAVSIGLGSLEYQVVNSFQAGVLRLSIILAAVLMYVPMLALILLGGAAAFAALYAPAQTVTFLSSNLLWGAAAASGLILIGIILRDFLRTLVNKSH